MQLTTVLGAIALPLLAAAAPAAEPSGPQPAPKLYSKVINNCPFNIYVSVDPVGAEPPSFPLELAANSVGYYSQSQVKGDANVFLIGKHPQLKKHLSFYSGLYQGKTHYDLADEQGNPFFDYRNVIDAKRAGCEDFDCAAGDDSCYSDVDNFQSKECKPTSLELTICASSWSGGN